MLESPPVREAVKISSSSSTSPWEWVDRGMEEAQNHSRRRRDLPERTPVQARRYRLRVGYASAVAASTSPRTGSL
jgi:hypothetical protein